MRPDRRPSALLACLLTAIAAPLGAANIIIINGDGAGEGFNDTTPVAPVAGNPATTLGAQRLEVFEAAAEFWGERLGSDVTIRVNAELNPLACDASSALLGFAGPETFFGNFDNAPLTETWYPVALANALAGSDLDPGFDDINAEFNRNLDDDPGCLGGAGWFYGIGVDTPVDQVGFFSTVLHEIGHGLGFLTIVNLATGAETQGFDDVFETFLEDHSTGESWPTMTNTERALSARDTGDLHWTGAGAIAAADAILSAGAHPGGHVRMFAPNPVQQGSSVSHWDTVLTPNELMEPFDTGDFLADLTIAAFGDIGWELLDGGGGGGACVPDATTLCLDDTPGDGRFQVRTFVDTTVGGGRESFANALALDGVGVTKGGLFFFNNQANPELLIKVLNGCAINGNYWVFWSAGTNVGLEITVTDTSTGLEQVYVNPDRTIAESVQDQQAFGCP